MLIKKISKKKPVLSIVNQIENTIVNHDLSPGEKLPPSRELQRMLGVSQGTLREALRILEHKGLIEVRPGRNGGLFVKAASLDKVNESLVLLIRQKQISVEDLIVFRKALEVSAAAWAAAKAEKKDINKLKKLLSDLEKKLEVGVEGFDQCCKVEDKLHRALVRTAKNPLFESVLNAVYENYPGYNMEIVVRSSEFMRLTLEDWKKMVKAISEGETNDAGWAMTDHFLNAAPLPSTAPFGSRS